MMNKISGIYGIRSQVYPERIYIGGSGNIIRRWREHKSELDTGSHVNRKLQNHYNKYGVNDLVFEVIVECSRDVILKVEQSFLDLYKPYFNILIIAGSPIGIKRSKEAIERMRKPKSEETKRRMRAAFANRIPRFGYSHSIKTKELMSKNNGRNRLVINLETGVFYNSIKAAAASANKPRTWLSDKLTGHTKNNTMFRYA